MAELEFVDFSRVGQMYLQMKKDYDDWRDMVNKLETFIKERAQGYGLCDNDYPLMFDINATCGIMSIDLVLACHSFPFQRLSDFIRDISGTTGYGIETNILNNNIHLHWNIADTYAYDMAKFEEDMKQITDSDDNGQKDEILNNSEDSDTSNEGPDDEPVDSPTDKLDTAPGLEHIKKDGEHHLSDALEDVSEVDIERYIVDMYKNGATIKKICELIHRGRDFVTNRLKKNKVRIRSTSSKTLYVPLRFLNKEQKKNICEAYRGGEKFVNIRKRFKVSTYSIHMILKEMGEPLRVSTSPQPVSAEIKQKIMEMYTAGATRLEIMEALDLKTDYAIYDVLKSFGISSHRKASKR